MAGFEDVNPEGSSIGRRANLHDSTHIVDGEFITPEFARDKKNKNIGANNAPLKCNGTSRLHGRAVVSANLNGSLKHFCNFHWAGVRDTEGLDHSSVIWHHTDQPKSLPGELRATASIEAKLSRAAGAQSYFETTGIHIPVRGSGRPPSEIEKIDGQEVESLNPVVKVIKTTAKTGGHKNITHESNLKIATAALKHSLSLNSEGPFNLEAYHKEAERLGMGNPADRDAYLTKAMASHGEKLAKNPISAPKNKVPELVNDVNLNYSNSLDNPSSFETTSSLMDSDTPSKAENAH